jgi:drug/metabolite transporter superfamily protein YnfA
MNRDRALKVVLVVVGLLFVAGVYPLMMFVRQEPALAMMLSLYVTLGIFLLLAARNPSANRSLIAFTAWSSFAHAALMGVQAFRNLIPRGELVGVAALVIIGVALIVLAPAKSVERVSAAVAQARSLGEPDIPILKEAKAQYAKLL